MIKKISTAIVCGITITLFLAQFDPWTHQKIIVLCQNIAQQTLYGTTSFTIESLNFFSPSLTLSHVTMTSFDNTWSWKCKKCTMHSSWIQLLLKGSMDTHIVMNDFDCSSTVQSEKLAIEDHIFAMMQGTTLPFASDLKSITFNNAQLSLSTHDHKQLSLLFNSSSLKIGAHLKTTMSIYDGAIKNNNEEYCKGITANIFITTWQENLRTLYTAAGSGLIHIPDLKDEGICYVSGSLESGRGRFSLRNAYNSLIIEPIIMTEKEIRLTATIPLSYCSLLLKQTNLPTDLSGNLHCNLTIARNETRHIDGHMVIQDCMINQRHILDTLKIRFTRRGHQWRSTLHITRANEESIGIGLWDEYTHHGKGKIYNTTQLSSSSISYWHIMPRNSISHFWINDKDVIGIYQIKIDNKLTKTHHCGQGGFSYSNGLCALDTLLDTNHLKCVIKTLPNLTLQECSYTDSQQKPLISLHHNPINTDLIEGTISFSFVRAFINTFFQYDVQGEGMFTLKGHASPEKIDADITLTDATIRLPETYNFIDEFHTHFSYNNNEKSYCLKDTLISLYTGKIECPHAIALCNQKGSLTFAHAPILINHCLLNSKKDLFAIVSGSILLSKKSPLEDIAVNGSLMIDRAQLKENIFSSVIQKRLFESTHSLFDLPHNAINCDLTIETKVPIKIDTAFLQTNAKINLRVQKQGNNPLLTGVVTLLSGNLIFPYKPLFINKGTLTFSPGQLFDPAIELIAKNKIKKYDLSLQIAGSLLNHHIMLDSSPPLSEEQIMTLLLVGSHESLLNSMIPTLIVQNLKNLVFANNQSTFLEKYFAPLLRPFNISLAPSFIDQTGRGGLRGMLEISIDDRWRALIQKNFSLTEDTRLELEFSLSDDITLRGIRDERRDIGGEIEMRWKF